MTAANIISAMIGVTIGAAIGYTLAAILIIGRQSDPRELKDKPTEPTRIFTKGCLVKWLDVVHEIDFMEERDGQTVAGLSKLESGMGFIVPVEELEAVEE